MKPVKKLILFLTIFLSSFSAQAIELNEITPATDEQIQKIRKSLEDTLFDAESARIKDAVIIKSAGTIDHVCGKVNSKNLYGAYVGYQWFMGTKMNLKSGLEVITIMPIGDVAEEFCDKLMNS